MDLAGTPYFIAPEVLSGNYGFECDIWSMGVVVYMMMTGTMPFDGDSQGELFKAIKTKHFEMPSHLSDGLKDFITMLLKKDPKQRPNAKAAMDHKWFSAVKN